MASLSNRRGNSRARALPGPDTSPPVGHVYLDVRRRLLYCLNEAARQMQSDGVPFTGSDLARQGLQTLSGEAVTPGDLPLMKGWREGRPCEATFVMARKGGAVQHLQWTAAPLRDARGEVVAIVGSVTARAPDPDWQVLAGLAHDLRSPLQAMKLLVSLAEGGDVSPAELKEVLGRIRTATEHALSVGSDVLEWCRGPAQGGRRVEPVWVPLEPFLASLADEQAVSARQKALVLVQDLAAARGWEVQTDRVRLSRLLTNLLGNAIRYTTAGRVEFRASWRDGPTPGARHLLLSVVDTGTGITSEEQESIFQPFERGRAGKGDSSSGGSGLGLAVVDRLVEELRLTLEVYSEYGRGSCFDLLLPATILREIKVQAAKPQAE
jgi:signal transduction histidine kinase